MGKACPFLWKSKRASLVTQAMGRSLLEGGAKQGVVASHFAVDGPAFASLIIHLY